MDEIIAREVEWRQGDIITPNELNRIENNIYNTKEIVTSMVDGVNKSLELILGDKIKLTTTINNVSFNGVTVSYSNEKLVCYGYLTSTRVLLCLNNQNEVKASSSVFSQTLPPGKYRAHIKASGFAANSGVHRLAYTTNRFQTEKILVEDGDIIETDVPIMLGFNFSIDSPYPKDYGTENNPTYLEISLSVFEEKANTESVKNINNILSVDNLINLELEPGTISSSNGKNNNDNPSKRRRTKEYYYCPLGFTLDIPEGLKLTADVYTTSSPDGFQGIILPWATGHIEAELPIGCQYVRFVLAKIDDSDFTNSDLNEPIELTTYSNVDKTLLRPNKAADAQVVGNILWKALAYKYRLDETTNIDELTDRGIYSFYSSARAERPINLPTSWGGIFLVVNDEQQIIINNHNNIWTRTFYSNEGWTNWDKIIKAEDIRDNEAIDSLATITISTTSGENTRTTSGITFKKIADNNFTLSGKSNGRKAKWFNCLLGTDEYGSDVSIVPTKNITTPGTYTVVWETNQADYKDALFSITENRIKDRRYLTNGESFEIKPGEGVALFVYAPTTADYSSNPLNVKWALYEGEDKKNYPYIEPNSLVISDKIARSKINYAIEQGRILSMGENSWGLANVLARAKHIKNIRWTPVGNIPLCEQRTPNLISPSFFSQEEHIGIPYSSVRDQDKAVGMDVSFRTFMTAVRDPNSVLYTRLSKVANSAAYYGTVCSGLVNYAFNIGLNLTNYYLSESDMFETIPMMMIQPGDVIWEPGHIALISGITKDEYGRIATVEVTEEARPLPRIKYYNSYASFLEDRNGYIARRFKNIGAVEYSPISYVQCFDEELGEEEVFPDVQTDHGDAAVFMEGENIKINVINQLDFTTITVTRDNDAVYTTNVIETFTLNGVQPGLYTITANGGENESVSTFYVVQATVSVSGNHVVTFSSTNATPVMVGVYNLPENNDMLIKNIILKSEDITRGSIDVSEYMDNEYRYVKVWFMTQYGTAVWYSESHQKWVEIIPNS